MICSVGLHARIKKQRPQTDFPLQDPQICGPSRRVSALSLRKENLYADGPKKKTNILLSVSRRQMQLHDQRSY